mgnify:CR=1 FL=1
MSAVNLDILNRRMASKIVEARVAHVFNTYANVLVTSSFGTSSAILLHVISRVRPRHPIYFIDTQYHFEETIAYKEQLTRLLNLNVEDVKPEPWKHEFTRRDRTWEKDPDFCCQINKVEPLDSVKKGHDIWLSGLIGYQNHHRSNLEFVEARNDIYKCYPMIDWSPRLVNDYMEQYGLPRHPLEFKGYGSVGCTHCTSPGSCRDGRWSGTTKSECGLHLR